MSKDLAEAHKQQFQRIVENLRAFALAFEACQSDVESLMTLIRETSDADYLNIASLNKNQILRTVAEKRIAKCRNKSKAAESLGIDVRTLRKYAAYEESDD